MEKPNNTVERNTSEDLKPIGLEPGIYDFTDEIENAFIYGTPLSDTVENILRTFKEDFCLEEDIQTQGREKILNEIEEIKGVFNFEEAKNAVKEGLVIAQGINPDIEMKEFPIVFLYVPFYGDAKSLYGQGCGISISSLRQSDKLLDTPYQRLVSYAAHEAVHVFLRQLGKNRSEKDTSPKAKTYHFIWEEGLATYMEPSHYAHHEVMESDAPFYLGITKEWFKSNDVEIKKGLLKKVFERSSTQKFFDTMFSKNRRPNLEDMLTDTSPDEIFNFLLKKHNGIGYHIGSYIWKKQIERGFKLKDLVMAGSTGMEELIEEYGY